MRRDRSRRRILTAGVGVVALTALPGLACGNPVSPGYELVEPQPQPQPQAQPTASESPNPLQGPIIPEPTATSSASTTPTPK